MTFGKAFWQSQSLVGCLQNDCRQYYNENRIFHNFYYNNNNWHNSNEHLQSQRNLLVVEQVAVFRCLFCEKL